MLKPKALKKGDKVAIVSLSSGLLGEPFIKFELDLGIRRMAELGLEPIFMPNSLKGIDFVKDHPELRAVDLKEAFKDPSIKGIICSIGGEDTYLTVPYLLDDPEFKEIVQNNPKIFIGFSDTTVNHLTLYKLGLKTYYGPVFTADIAEFEEDMLPYTKMWFEQLFKPNLKQIESSPVWYMERDSYTEDQLGVPRIKKEELRGYEVLQGSGKIQGQFLGGCIESLYCMFVDDKQPDQVEICTKYKLFPSLQELKNAVFFFETSDDKMPPETYKKAILLFKEMKVFETVRAVIVGKPTDEVYYDEYKQILIDCLSDVDVPILYNVNFSHATPRCIIPYGCKVQIDFDEKKITLLEKMVSTIDYEELVTHVDDDDRLIHLPGKQKLQVLAYEYLASKFEKGKKYTEKEVNEVIDAWHTFNDAASLRRDLINYQHLSRTNDGAKYWVNTK